jgi:hypothetical protein
MLQIKNTNLTLKGGEIILTYTYQDKGIGERILVICDQEKGTKTLNKYKKIGLYLYGKPVFYNNVFYLLNKNLKQATKKGRQIVIGNELYHIEKHILNGGKITIE